MWCLQQNQSWPRFGFATTTVKRSTVFHTTKGLTKTDHLQTLKLNRFRAHVTSTQGDPMWFCDTTCNIIILMYYCLFITHFPFSHQLIILFCKCSNCFTVTSSLHIHVHEDVISFLIFIQARTHVAENRSHTKPMIFYSSSLLEIHYSSTPDDINIDQEFLCSVVLINTNNNYY